jgi:hypothetical protein
MAVLVADDPADGLHQVCETLSLGPSGEPSFTDLGEATHSDFEGLGIGTFGPCVILVGKNLHWRVPERAFAGFALGLLFFSSENWGGTNEVRIFEHGRQVASWEEAGAQDAEHPLLAGLPDDLHPFDRVQRVAERVLGVEPLGLLEQPLFVIHEFG